MQGGLPVKKRIWELDAFRGLFVIGMVVVHLIYDLQSFAGLPILKDNAIYDFVAHWGGVLFFLISGICVTLGSHPIRRGLIVLGCGLAVSAATFGMYLIQFADASIIIYFGVLHCLGTCMLLWPLLKKCHWAISAFFAVGCIAAGFWLDSHRFDTGLLLMPLGVIPDWFASSDYFPLLPNLGFFLTGVVLGKTLYKNKTTLLPKVSTENILVKSLIWVGKWSLPVYMLHQPVLAGIAVILGVLL